MFTRSFNVYISARDTVCANLQRVSKVAKKSRFAFLYLHLRLRMRQNKIRYNLQQKLVQNLA